MSIKLHSPIYPHPVVKWVPLATGKGLTNSIDKRHIKKWCLLPSATSHNEFSDEDYVLSNQDKFIFFCAIRPYRGGFDKNTLDPNKEEFKEWKKEIRGLFDTQKQGFFDSGNEFHDAVAAYWEGGTYPSHKGGAAMIEQMAPIVKSLGATKVVCEQILGGPEVGWVGTPDWVAMNDANEPLAVFDGKETGEGNFNKAKTYRSLYESWRIQLGQYRLLLKSPDIPVYQAISCRETGEAKIVQHESGTGDVEAGRHQIAAYQLRRYGMLLANRWKEVKDDPKIMAEIRNIHEINNGGQQ